MHGWLNKRHNIERTPQWTEDFEHLQPRVSYVIARKL